jgi:membrane protein
MFLNSYKKKEIGRVIKCIGIIKYFSNQIKKHKIGTYAAQCAYFTILSAIPFLIFLITILQYTSINSEELIQTIHNILPESISVITIDIVQEIYSKSITTISISIIFVIWSAGKGIYSLLIGLQNVYEIKYEKQFIIKQIQSRIITVIFALICVVVLISSVIENIKISKIIIYITLFFSILLIYTFIVTEKNNIKKQIPGAIISTISCYIITAFFSLYIKKFVGFSIIYGSLTTIALLMIWIYFCMYCILLGAEINYDFGDFH